MNPKAKKLTKIQNKTMQGITPAKRMFLPGRMATFNARKYINSKTNSRQELCNKGFGNKAVYKRMNKP